MIKSAEIKQAETKHDIHELITRRWSPRSFSEKAISDEQMEELFEAASWAPSSRNEQPWMYIYAHRGDEAFQKFVNCLADANQVWAKDAAVLVVCLTRQKFDYKNRENKHAEHDLGAANLQLILQAGHREIYGHMMAGFDKEKTIETFSISSDVEPVCFMALGYLADPEKLDDKLRKGETTERTRKDLKEFVFKNSL